MPNFRSPATLMLQITIMELIKEAEAFGISKPLIMAGLKQIGQGMGGTALSQIPDSGFTKSLLTQFIKDTRNWHLYVFSGIYQSKAEFVYRLLQYVAIEGIGISCGQLNNGAVAVLTGALRNSIITARLGQIANDAVHIQKIRELETSVIAFAALCASKGGTKCKALKQVIMRLKGGQANPGIYLIPPSSVEIPRININYLESQMRFKLMYENMVQQHTLHRYINGSAQKAYKALRYPFFYSTATRIIPLNIAGIIGYGLLALTGVSVLIVGSLVIFQYAENCRYNSSYHSDIIDVKYSIEDEDI